MSRVLLNLGYRPGDVENNHCFIDNLADHDDKMPADRLTQYFSEVAAQYPPLSINALSEKVKYILSPDHSSQCPELMYWEVLDILKKG